MATITGFLPEPGPRLSSGRLRCSPSRKATVHSDPSTGPKALAATSSASEASPNVRSDDDGEDLADPPGSWAQVVASRDIEVMRWEWAMMLLTWQSAVK